MKEIEQLAFEQPQAEDATCEPAKNDWFKNPGYNHFEVQYAFEKFHGRSLSDIYSHFENALTISETLAQLPEIPMRYYFKLYLHYVIHERKNEETDPGRACAAFYACLYGFDLNQDAMLRVMPDLLPQLQFIAENQNLFDEQVPDESVDGAVFTVYDFKKLFQDVLKKYDEAR